MSTGFRLWEVFCRRWALLRFCRRLFFKFQASFSAEEGAGCAGRIGGGVTLGRLTGVAAGTGDFSIIAAFVGADAAVVAALGAARGGWGGWRGRRHRRAYLRPCIRGGNVLRGRGLRNGGAPGRRVCESDCSLRRPIFLESSYRFVPIPLLSAIPRSLGECCIFL